MTTNDVAAALGITPGGVRDAIRAGALSARRVGRDWYVTPGAVERYRVQSLGRPGRRRVTHPDGRPVFMATAEDRAERGQP